MKFYADQVSARHSEELILHKSPDLEKNSKSAQASITSKLVRGNDTARYGPTYTQWHHSDIAGSATTDLLTTALCSFFPIQNNPLLRNGD